ncbi:hypothetical protein IQ243_13515 [Nostocales cyanobacterium LEGE 11386]|nr:hypothetical protein [Nostocales cyanobacterium LEGE 11386]
MIGELFLFAPTLCYVAIATLHETTIIPFINVNAAVNIKSRRRTNGTAQNGRATPLGERGCQKTPLPR